MICSVCNKTLNPEWVFCIVCGTSTSQQRRKTAAGGSSRGSVGSSTLTMSVGGWGQQPSKLEQMASYYSEASAKKSTSKARKSRLKQTDVDTMGPLAENVFISRVTTELSEKARDLTRVTDNFIAECKRKGKDFGEKYDLLEIINGSNLESTYESLAHSSLNYEPSVVSLPSSAPTRRSKFSQPTVEPSNEFSYLDEVEPVTIYYKQLMAREEELRGLKSVCKEERIVSEVQFSDSVGMLWTDCQRFQKPQTPAETQKGTAHDDECAPIMLWTDILLKGRELAAKNDLEDEGDDDDSDSEIAEVHTEEVALTEEQKRNKILADLMNDVVSYAAKSAGKYSPQRSPNRSQSPGIEGSNYEDIRVFPAFSMIGKAYLNSIRLLRATMREHDLKFGDTTKFDKSGLSKLKNSIDALQNVLSESRSNDQKAKSEFDAFHKRSQNLRTEAAVKVAEELQRAADICHEYSVKYESAKKAFDERNKRNIGFVSATGRHIVSDAVMDEIQRQAEQQQLAQGIVVQKLQAEETALVLKLRSEEATAIMAFQHWRPKHARAVEDVEILLAKIVFLRRNIAAKMIQGAARKKLLMYFRKGFTFRRNRRGIIIPSSVGFKK